MRSATFLRQRRRRASTPSQLETLEHEHALLVSLDERQDDTHVDGSSSEQQRFADSNWRSVERTLRDSSSLSNLKSLEAVLSLEDPFSCRSFETRILPSESFSHRLFRESQRSSLLSASSSSSLSSSRIGVQRKPSTDVSCLINPSIQFSVEAIAIMTVHEISSVVYGQHKAPSTLSSSSADHPRPYRPSLSSSHTLLPRHSFEALWRILEETGLKDFNKSVLYVHRVPEHWEICKFWNQLYFTTRFSPECLVIAMVYVSRILNNPYGVTLSSITWRPLFFCCSMLAHKYWDDDYLANLDFVQGYPGHTGLEANQLERTVLKLLEYRVGVLPSAYASSYFGLRAAVMLAHEKSYRRSHLKRCFQTHSAHPNSDRRERRDTVASTSSTMSTTTGSSPSCFNDASDSLPALGLVEHTELRRSLLNIIHGEQCPCQQRRSSNFHVDSERGDGRDEEGGHADDLCPRADQRKRVWTYSVRQAAGQLLRRFIPPAGAARRNSIGSSSICHPDGGLVEGGQTKSRDHLHGEFESGPRRRRHTASGPPLSPSTFNRSIITMAIHPYAHFRTSNYATSNTRSSSQIENQPTTLLCAGETKTHYSQHESPNRFSQDADNLTHGTTNRYLSLPLRSPYSTPCSAPGAFFRRSLSFESLPTLKKGLHVDGESSQPPIIGHETPIHRLRSYVSEENDEWTKGGVEWDATERYVETIPLDGDGLSGGTVDDLQRVLYHPQQHHHRNQHHHYYHHHPYDQSQRHLQPVDAFPPFQPLPENIHCTPYPSHELPCWDHRLTGKQDIE